MHIFEINMRRYKEYAKNKPTKASFIYNSPLFTHASYCSISSEYKFYSSTSFLQRDCKRLSTAIYNPTIYPSKPLARVMRQAPQRALAVHSFSFVKPCNSHVSPHIIPCTKQYCNIQFSSFPLAKIILHIRFTASSTNNFLLNRATSTATTTISPTATQRAATSPVNGASMATVATSMNMKASNRSMNSTNPHATSPYSNERLSTSCSL